MHLTPCELHTLPDGLVLCHAGIPASLLFTSRHSSCNSSGEDCFTASLVQSAECAGDASAPPQAHSHILSRTPAMDAKPIPHFLDAQLLPGLDGDRVAGVPLGPPELNSTIMAAPAESY